MKIMDILIAVNAAWAGVMLVLFVITGDWDYAGALGISVFTAGVLILMRERTQ